ncbi:PD-(D/E)XK nuclease family transposase, partial [Sphingobacterium griseoflavum]
GADLQSDLDRWLYVLKNMSKLDGLPVHLRQPIFEQLFEIAAYTQLNKEERHMYDVSLKRKWDAAVVRKYQEQEQAKTREALKAAEAALKAAEAAEEALVTGLKEAMDKGLIEGLEKGLEKGLEQGLEQGLEHGLEQGAHRKAIAIATTMKKSGISAEDIAIYTGLSLADIEALSTSK